MIDNPRELSYNTMYSTSIIKDIMKLCFDCGNCFSPVGPEKGCSIKCKLLGDVRKEGECWFFKNATSGPYSKIRWNKKWYLAHRCSYEVFKGPIPDGMWVCHKCDNPKCINPDHLFIGSAKDNAKDCRDKGRTVTGEKNNLTKYTDIQIAEMRLLRNDGFTYERLCRIFNCSMTYLSLLFNNKLRIER